MFSCDTNPNSGNPYGPDDVIQMNYRVRNPNQRRLATALDQGNECLNAGREATGNGIAGFGTTAAGGTLVSNDAVLQLDP